MKKILLVGLAACMLLVGCTQHPGEKETNELIGVETIEKESASEETSSEITEDSENQETNEETELNSEEKLKTNQKDSSSTTDDKISLPIKE
jgi:hypothetical protein